jgi:ribonuclease E
LTKAKAEPKKEAKAEPKKDAKAEPKKEAKAEPKKALSRPAVVFALAPIKLRQKEKYN